MPRLLKQASLLSTARPPDNDIYYIGFRVENKEREEQTVEQKKKKGNQPEKETSNHAQIP